LLSSSVVSVTEGICVLLSGNCRYIRVFKLLVHLGIRACLAILPRGLFCRNLLLLGGPFYLSATAFYKVSIEFLFRLSRDFKQFCP
jgi:hypothetical protein